MANASKITMTEGDAPDTPPVGSVRLYAKSDNKYYFKDSNGVETALAGSSGTSGSAGATGSAGSHGTSGTSGSAGATGSAGSHGTSGTSGTGYPVRAVQIILGSPTDDASTGNGKAYFVVPDELNAFNLVRVAATLMTAGGTGGSCGIALTNTGTAGTGTVAMLSANMEIEGSEMSTRTSATPGTIDTNNDNVTTGQIIRVDVPNVHTTAGKGLIIELAFSL
jgi:hypothetical protein